MTESELFEMAPRDAYHQALQMQFFEKFLSLPARTELLQPRLTYRGARAGLNKPLRRCDSVALLWPEGEKYPFRWLT